MGAAAGTQQSVKCRGTRDVRVMLAPGLTHAPGKQGIAGIALGERARARTQMWQAVAAGGSSRQDSKQACMRAEMRACHSVCAGVHAETYDVAAKRQDGACLSRTPGHPCYKNRPLHTRKERPDTHTKSALCSITLSAGLTKSTRMHKHATEKRAGAGHSHACSWLHPTHTAAPEHALPAPRRAFPAPQWRRRQHT